MLIVKNRKSKICSICRKNKPLDNFYKESRRADGHGYLCKPCCKEYLGNRYRANPEHFKKIQLKYLKNNPQKRKSSILKHQFGITIEQYDMMIKMQNGLCAICEELETAKHQNGIVKQLSVDHNHKSGKIRGLLCHRCNLSIGLLKEDRKIFINALKYLEKNS